VTPKDWVDEFGNYFCRDPHLLQYRVLSLFLFLLVVFLYVFGKDRRISVRLQLMLERLGCCAYRHSCAMETEWEQNIVAIKHFVSGVEVALR
jgi:hypothetical protein